jgi:hypothetical protein
MYYQSTEVHPAALMGIVGPMRNTTFMARVEKIQLFQPMHWVFNFDAAFPIYAKTTMVLFQYLALVT